MAPNAPGVDVGALLGALLGALDGGPEADGEPLAAEPAQADTITTRAARAAERRGVGMAPGRRTPSDGSHRARQARRASIGA